MSEEVTPSEPTSTDIPVQTSEPEESKTITKPYGADAQKPAATPSPSLHSLATQQVEEAFGPDAHNNPTFDERVKDVEAQMLDSIKKTKGL